MKYDNLPQEPIHHESYDLGYEQGRADAIDEILSLERLNHYDMYNELMYQSIKVCDVEQLKEQKV